jgi:hypothetical protein
VKVDITVQNVGCDPSNATAENNVKIDNSQGRSTTSTSGSANTGSWAAQTQGTSKAHEVGHLMGLKDDYKDVRGQGGTQTSVPDPGHAGHMMASNPGIVAPHEIADVVSGPVTRAMGTSSPVVTSKVP